MKETYYLISSWLDNWNKRFGSFKKDELRNLFFKKSFVNIARAATVALENHYYSKPQDKIQKNQKNSWGRDLLECLGNYYKNKSWVIELLKAEHKKDIEDLGKELNKGAYDIQVIYPILQRIKIGLSNRTIGVEFINELKLDDKANANKLDYLAEMLIQNNISNHDLNYLKDLPQKSIARRGADFFLKEFIDKLIADGKLTPQLWSGFIRFLSEETDSGRSNDVLNPKSDSIFNLVNSYYWENLIRKFLKQLTVVFVNEILTFKGKKDSVAEKLEKNTTLHKKIGLAVLKLYAPSLIKAVLHFITDKPARDEDSNLSICVSPLGEWMKEKAGFVDNQSSSSEKRFNTVDLVVTESFATPAGEFISEFLFEETSIKSETKIIVDIGKQICSSLALDVRESDMDWNDISDESFKTLCGTWSARTTLHGDLKQIFAVVTDLIIKSMPDALNSFSLKSILTRSHLKNSFAVK